MVCTTPAAAQSRDFRPRPELVGVWAFHLDLSPGVQPDISSQPKVYWLLGRLYEVNQKIGRELRCSRPTLSNAPQAPGLFVLTRRCVTRWVLVLGVLSQASAGAGRLLPWRVVTARVRTRGIYRGDLSERGNREPTKTSHTECGCEQCCGNPLALHVSPPLA
jgi:hypothetical protein